MIEMKGVWKTFGKKEARVEALRGIDLSISQGEMVAIMGKSGSGKSTLLNILGGMMPMDDGAYLYQGRQIAGLGQKALARFRRRTVVIVTHDARVAGSCGRMISLKDGRVEERGGRMP